MPVLRVRHRDGIEWKSFLRIAAPLAGLVGIVAFYVPLLWLVLFPGSIFFAVYVYRRRQLGPLKPAHGAKMGIVIGLLTFAVVALLLTALIAHDPAGYRQDRENEMKEAMARNPSPQSAQVAQVFSGTRGVALLTVVGMAMLLVLTLVIGSASGALAASLARNRAGP